MERRGILNNPYNIDPGERYTPNIEETPKYLWKDCGGLMDSKCALRCHMKTQHSDHITIYNVQDAQEYNNLDNIRIHARNKHQGQVTTKKTTQ